MFAYKNILEKKVQEKKDALEEKDRNLPYASIQPILRMDQKMKLAGNLLNDHIAVTGLFSLLEQSTLENLRFTDFSFSYLSKDKIALSMKGQAHTFESVANQASAFASSTIIGSNFKNGIFSDIALDQNGNITFSFLTSLNPSLISYRNNISSAIRPGDTTSISEKNTSTATGTIRIFPSVNESTGSNPLKK